MKVTVIPIVIGALGTVNKVLELEEICCHSDSRGKPSANDGVENSQMSKIIRDDIKRFAKTKKE